MTEVTFYRTEAEEIRGFRVEGHADYADEGEDIVCAAISALTINTVNSILELTNDEPDIDQDEDEDLPYFDVSFFDPPSADSQLLLKSLLLGLTNLESDPETSDFIHVTFEEV